MLPVVSTPRRVVVAPPPSFPPTSAQAAQEAGTLNSKCSWLGADKFRPLLASFTAGKTKSSIAALFRLQAFFNDIDFPLGDKNVPILLRVFEALYQDDIIEEGPMQDWRNDMRNATPGHDKALLQLEGCVSGLWGGGGRAEAPRIRRGRRGRRGKRRPRRLPFSWRPYFS